MNINSLVARAFQTIINNPLTSQSIKSAAIQAQSVKVIVNYRLRVCAGKAKASINRETNTPIMFWIEINPTLFKRIDENEQYNVVSHEVSHIIDFFLRGSQNGGHDAVWKHIHFLCGGNGKTFHNYDTSGLKKKIQRIVIRDNITLKELRVTIQTFKKVCNYSRYTHIKTEIYQGKTLLETRTI